MNTDTAAADAGAATEPAAAADGEHEAPAAHAAHQEIHDVAFSFEGPFGKYEQFQLQRGLQIYTEVCSACHGLKQVPLRTLHDAGGPGLPEDQMRAYAQALTIPDPATGEDRPREPTDYFPTITGEGMGPDLSLMAKARAGFHGPYGTGISQLFNGIGGPEYIYSILTGYTGKTKEQAGATFYENKAFPGGWIGMPPPLSDEQVTFEDGSPNDLHSEAKDIAAFLMWTAEPKMMARKQAGLVSVLFLVVLSALLYLTNKRLWWPLKHRRDVIGDGR
ncbi:cytochrome c1 [Paracoccus contaminans]|uniref:cytochrome c1 n=1 Tax=Paracoccus contaminans TaxID=1945662 RepID=UPI001F0A6E17|nr:cytochrome c1 [Paracoccus contaminans]